MKKTISVIMTVVMLLLVFSLTACKKDVEETQAVQPDVEEPAQEEVEVGRPATEDDPAPPPMLTPDMPQGDNERRPEHNPFQNMTAEEEECLRKYWDDQAFEEITGFVRPPFGEEEQAMFECLNYQPAMPPGLEGELNGAPNVDGQPQQPQPGGDMLPQDGPMGGQQGPFYHQVMLADSTDGLIWTVAEEPVREHASVPEVALLPEGGLMIYFVDGTVDDVNAVRQAEDGSWEDVDFVLEDRPTQKAYDPDVVQLPDGGMRLFYYGPPEKLGPVEDQENSIYSAVSQDGVVFKSEEGIRITVKGVTDPSVVILPDGSWLMALSRGQETLLASSADGVDFTLTDSSVTAGGVPELVVLPDEQVRLFVTGRDGIMSLISSDGGATWEEEVGTRILAEEGNVAADPSVVQLGDGSWLMAWKQFMPDSLPTGLAPAP